MEEETTPILQRYKSFIPVQMIEPSASHPTYFQSFNVLQII